MSKTRDNSPELDYFELRRRHEEYKRARSAPQVEKNPVEERLERQVAQRKARPEPVVEEAPINDVQDELKVEAKTAPMDAFEEAIEENYEAYEDDMDYEGEEDAANPNPFDSFIRFFSGVKSNMASRRHKDDELEDLDLDDLTDEELAELEGEELMDLDEEFEEEAPAPVKPRFSLRRNAQPDVDEEDEDEADAPVADIEDIDAAPIPARKAPVVQEPLDSEFADDDFDGELDELDEEDFEDEDDLPRKSGFKKFVNLFVTRIDEDEYEEDEFEEDELEDADFDDDEEIEEIEDLEEIEEEEAPVRRGLFKGRKNKAHRISEAEAIYGRTTSEIQIRPEGGQGKMDEMNKQAYEPAAQADAVETSGMTRRERRERAMRLAAEEAARKAAEEAQAKAEAQVEPLFTDLEVKQAPVDMAAFGDAPETDLIVETTAEEIIETVDEPTREFTPVSMRDVQEAAEKAIFDVNEDEDDEDYDDEDDDEEEIVEKKPRRGLFGRKRAKDEDDDEDFDDEDYDEDDEDEDDDEEEIVEKKPRRGLFGRKRAKDEDDDEDFDDEDEEEDDEDLDDDYDDEDDDEEYDEYDDDEEDDYDEDDDDDEYDEDYDDDDEDDEPRRSFGHHLIGVFKIILGLVLILLVLVIGLNFHYFITGENAVVTKAHEMLGDSSASDVLCFGYVMREAMPAEEAAAPVVETELPAVPAAQPQAEAAIPDLGSNGAITESPVVESAPVVEAAPAVQEAPVTSGSIG